MAAKQFTGACRKSVDFAAVYFLNQRFSRREVPVERPGAHACGVSDALQRHAGTAGRKLLRRDEEDALTAESGVGADTYDRMVDAKGKVTTTRAPPHTHSRVFRS